MGMLSDGLIGKGETCIITKGICMAKKLTSKEFDELFDKGEDITDYLDTEKAMTLEEFMKKPEIPNEETIKAMENVRKGKNLEEVTLEQLKKEANREG